MRVSFSRLCLCSLTCIVLVERLASCRNLMYSSATDGPDDLPFIFDSRTSHHNVDAPGYMGPLEEFRIQYESVSDLPGPLAVIEQYKALHSEEALRRNPHNRTFLVAYYQCPVSAGNWLHQFTSDFFWSILLNRTMLWKFVDYDTCHYLVSQYVDARKPFKMHRCKATLTECDRVLTRAPWIASYDVWKERLNLPEPVHIHKKYAQGFSKVEEYPYRTDVQPMVALDTAFSEELIVDIQPFVYSRMSYMYHMEGLRAKQLQTPIALATAEKLGEWGSPFLFGLLWRYAFDYSTSIRRSIMEHPAVQRQVDDNTLTVAIHSRHVDEDDNGCNVEEETTAMQRVAKLYRQLNRTSLRAHFPCQVTLASDRQCTIEQLSIWVKDVLNCSPIVAQHGEEDPVYKEHGPFSGGGYFQDLLLAGKTVKDAMIGSLEGSDGLHWRSSSELLEESIAYYRAMSYYQSGRDPKEQSPMIWGTLPRGLLNNTTVARN